MLQKEKKFHLIPLKGKVPTEDGWQQWCTTPSPYPSDDLICMNSGIPCGPANGIIVLDVDDQNLFQSYCTDNGSLITDTYSVKSGGGHGVHYYYLYPDDGNVYGNRSRKKNGFDIRGVGGQVVAPGSIHPDTGAVYSILSDLPIAPAPQWLLDLAKKSSAELITAKEPDIQSEKINETEIRNLKISDTAKELILLGKPKGQRSEAIITVLIELIRAEIKEDTIVSIFEDYPIGEKYREKGANRRQWLYGEIGRAKTFLSTKAPAISSPPMTPEELIRQYNEKYAVVMRGNKTKVVKKDYDPVFDREVITYMSVDDFKQFYSNQKVVVESNIKPAASYWLNHPKRKTYQGVIFLPHHNKAGYLNLWSGFSVEPIQGDCHLYLDHIKEVICNGNEDYYKYVMAWLANVVQNPGNRPGVALVAQGGQGTGKGVWVNWFGSLFGPHFLHISHQSHLTGNFNSHLENCVLLFADEAYWAGDKSEVSTLKSLITEDTIVIEPKGRDVYQVKNYVNMIICSNYEWVVPAEADERRFCVFQVNEKYKQNNEYFKAISDQMQHGGREALLYELMNMNISDIDLRTRPKTNAMIEQKVLSLQPVQKFWYDCLWLGTILSDDDGWPSQVFVDDIYAKFTSQPYARNKQISVQAFGQNLCKITSHNLTTKRMVKTITVDKCYQNVKLRKLAYIIPGLYESRMAFEMHLGGEIDWPSEEPIIIEEKLCAANQEDDSIF
ncbi:MAG: DUF5906 domain-containing protein [Candidatus Latescibacterota bacterium]